MASLCTLPRDVLGQLLWRCDCVSVVRMSRTCSVLNDVGKDESLWEKLFLDLGLRWRTEGWAQSCDVTNVEMWRSAFCAVASSSQFVRQSHTAATVALPNSTHLQDLVDSIEGSGIIFLSPGTYRQSITIQGKKQVSFIGCGRFLAAIRPESGTAIEVGDGAHVSVSNMTLVGGWCSTTTETLDQEGPAKSRDAVLRVCGGNLVVDHCDIVSKSDAIDVEEGSCDCSNSDI
eukprot:3437628-Rhodomonas_salina.3